MAVTEHISAIASERGGAALLYCTASWLSWFTPSMFASVS